MICQNQDQKRDQNILSEETNTKSNIDSYITNRESTLLSKCIADVAANGPTLYYHNFNHAIKTRDQARYYAITENIPSSDYFILDTASIMHDRFCVPGKAGQNELDTANYVRNFLPSIGYSIDETEKIAKLIEVTDVTKEPKNILEKIIKDSDTANLGTDEFFEACEKLYLETKKYLNPNLTKIQWYQGTLHFMSMHRYYTATALKNAIPKKETNMISLKKKIDKMLEII